MSSPSPGTDPASGPELAAEQVAVTDLYRRLDANREHAVYRFKQALAMPAINPQATTASAPAAEAMMSASGTEM